MRYLTAGESHGPALVGIVEGFPAGLAVTAGDIDRELARRQGGYGRGGRQTIERDRVRILAGVRHGRTTGAPIALYLENRDHENWREVLSPEPPSLPADLAPEERDRRLRRVWAPRPGHADLAGALKYGHTDVRDVLERASARETAMRVAIGALARRLLAELGIAVVGQVKALGGVVSRVDLLSLPPEEVRRRTDASAVYTLDPEAEGEMIRRIDEARREGDTLGGVLEVAVWGVPPGVGSYVHWDRKLDARLARAAMSVQAIKGVEIGDGFSLAGRRGSEAHDAIAYDAERGFVRPTNRAGGIEGGTSNGMPILLRAAKKPIPTLMKNPLPSVDLRTKEPVRAAVERSDVTAVPAALVVLENVIAWEIAAALVETFPADRLDDLKDAVARARERMRGDSPTTRGGRAGK
ncbi:MAG: Chorismate synthase [Brockia lithotrophica]|uniref:Chorismate synthase n=1 Tax=Brockia lithotrophica TaxID=933949 RepID=A0A2T5G8K3_9BACL|nr:chorismate synthase [Brockia lithotrophica]PTQ52499.1 MAG: Chorismate synthase [Brockia lithotrophica]